jgi:hypothetical protein
MNNTIHFFRQEVVDKSAKKRILIVMGIMLFFGLLIVVVSFT